MHYPPETATIMLLARMIATVRQARDKEGALHLFMQVSQKFIDLATRSDNGNFEEISDCLLLKLIGYITKCSQPQSGRKSTKT